MSRPGKSRPSALAKPPVLIAISSHADLATRRHAAEAGFDLHLVKPIEPAVIDQLWVLVEGLVGGTAELGAQRARLDRLREENVLALRALVASHIEMGYSLLYVARTTHNKLTRDRCILKVQHLYDRLAAWIKRNPHQLNLRDDLEDLLHHLPNA